MTSDSIVRTSLWVVELESQTQHLVRLLSTTSLSEDWEGDLDGHLQIDELENVEGIWLQDSTAVLVYRRMNTLDDMALGNAQKSNEIKFSIELTSGNKKDFNIIKRLLEELFWSQDSVATAIGSGRTERRWRLILNSQMNLSDVMSRMFREVMEVTMHTYVAR